MSTDPTGAEEISLPLRMYFTAQDSPHWSKEGDDGEQRRAVQRMRRNHQFAELVESLKRLVSAAHEARSLDASGMSLEGAKHLQIRADHAHSAIRTFVLDMELAADRYREAELAAHTETPEGFQPSADQAATAHEVRAAIDAGEPIPFKPTASPAEVAARAIADLKAQKEARLAPVTELRYTSESKR